MSNNSALIADVADTSFWVAHFRAKESERPDAMFRDPFATLLVGEHGKKIAESMSATSRHVEWAVISRTVIIDRFIDELIKQGVDTVINLGAGLDTRPYRMNLPAQLQWIEVDYPRVIDHKNSLLKAEQPRCNLARVALDLADRNKRKQWFLEVAAHARKVLIITEGVIPYLSQPQVAELAEDLRVHSCFKYWITEYFHPRVYPYLQKAVRTAQMQNAPFLFYPDDWFGFFENHGWIRNQLRYSSEIAMEFKRQPPIPLIAKLLMPFLPEKVKQESMRMTGYVVLEPRG
jgi:methyltransferase (TIGR00027 family)